MKSTDGSDAHGSDEAFERLQAADPAASATPDLTAVRAKVDAAVDADETGTAPAPTRVVRPSARWFQLAAVSAGVLAVGLGGYALGGLGADPTPQAEEQATLEGPVETLPGATGPGADLRGPAPESAAATADTMRAPGWGTRTTFDSVGLDDVAGRARAWGFDPSSVFSDATVAQLAAALGVSGVPELSYGSWRVGPVDWSGPVVELSSDGLASFYFSDQTLGPSSVDESTAQSPTVEAAQTMLTDVMAAMGVDSAGFELESPDDLQSPGARWVRAHRVVDGVRTGQAWEITVTEGGVAGLSGQLAPVVDLGEYDVVGAQSAVARLADPRFGTSGGDMIAYSRDLTTSTEAAEMAPDMMVEPGGPMDPTAVPVLPGTPQPGSSFAWPVQNVTLTGATLASSIYHQPDGSAVLLPTYTFTDGSGGQWSTVAVAEAHLSFAPQG